MEAQKSQAILQHNLDQVRELLDKHQLVEHMVQTQDQRRHELVESLVRRQHLAELRNRLGRLHVADVAYILENLPPAERLLVWEQVREPRGGDVLLELSDTVRAQIIEATGRGPLLAVLRQLDADDLTYLAEDLPAYSGPRRTAIPVEREHRFRSNVNMHSGSR